MYYHDEPIKNFEGDLLGRGSFARLLAQTLIRLKTEDTFTIGLYGKWGSGKTSIVNMALEELTHLQQDNPEKIVVIHFEPWQFSDSQQLLNQFIIRLANEFNSKKDKAMNAIGSALQSYSVACSLAEFIPGVGSTIATIGKFSLTQVGKKLQNDISKKDILQQKSAVIKLLKEQKAKILVVIDDIDRLSSEQIRQIFQLVASVAKFPNTAYLLVFDKDIVVDALQEVQKGNGEDYLHKIIQMPIQIPEIPQAKLHEVLFANLNKIAEDYPISFQQEHWNQVFMPCVSPFVSNLRDVNRLLNSLQFKLTTIASEVEFSDMVAICAIEIGAPKVFEWIKNHKSTLLGQMDVHTIGMSHYSSNDWLEKYTAEFGPLIDDRIQTTGYAKDRMETTLNAISYLFPAFANRIGKNSASVDNGVARKQCFICNEDKFDRYFNLDIDMVFITQAMIRQIVFSYSKQELEDYIFEKESQGKAYELLQEIRAMLSDVSKERMKVLFMAFVNVISRLYLKCSRSFLENSSYALTEYIIYDVLNMIPEIERYSFFIQALNESVDIAIEPFAKIINMVELAHGRGTAKGEERSDLKKSFTVEELNLVEKTFVVRCKQILESKNLFDLPRWRMMLTLLDAFDKEYTDDYVSKAMQVDANVVAYISFISSTWIGSGVSYEIYNPPYLHTTRERILEAIDNLIKSQELFTLKEETQYQAGAFYLHSQEPTKRNWLDGHIPQKAVISFLESKKKK